MLVVTKAAPMNYVYEGDSVVEKPNWGGVASAFLGALDSGDTWIALSEGNANRQRMRGEIIRVPHNGKTINLRPILANPDLVNGFLRHSNLGLWFLSHAIEAQGEIPAPSFDYADALAYNRINAMAAASMRSALNGDTGQPVLVNDYQFSSFALMARDNGTQNPLGNFLHIPLPSPELIRGVYGQESPMEMAFEDYIAGLLRFDLVGVHTREYLDNLASTAENIYKGIQRIDSGDKTRLTLKDGRSVSLSVRPIGIDVETVASQAALHNTLEAYVGNLPGEHDELGAYIRELHSKGVKIIGSLERVDPTKGIRLGDIERLLEHGHRVAYIGVFPSTRDELKPYADEKRELNDYAARINERFANKFDYNPVTIINEGIRPPNNVLFLRDLDVVYPGHKRDGFDLVALETIVAQGQKPEGERGVLVLGDCGVRHTFDDYASASGLYQTAGLLERARYEVLEEAVESNRHISDGLVRAAHTRGNISNWMNGLKEDLYAIGK